ncbi:hypothetical protein FACS1894109_04520 [Spirochaetia bacterium]|nr:hypothetical protein FACS1894109_04520 [Spirochaetia bacterium]
MDSWKKKLIGYDFILWNLENFNINTSPWVKQAFEAKKYAFAADFIRLYAVYNFGGIYLDMDIEVLKPFDQLLVRDIMISYEQDGTNCFEAACFGAIKGSVYIKKCLDYYTGRSFLKDDGTYDEKPLPYIMYDTAIELFHKNNAAIYSSDFFSPKNYETRQLNLTKNTYTIHHYDASWMPLDFVKIRWVVREKVGYNFFSEYLIKIISTSITARRHMVYFKERINERGILKALRYYYVKYFCQKLNKI